jgi:hypothetical protein
MLTRRSRDEVQEQACMYIVDILLKMFIWLSFDQMTWMPQTARDREIVWEVWR